MKIGFEALLEKFGAKGEKTGWTYISVPLEITERLKPGCKKSFRVKGFIDEHSIKAVALIPMGDGHFILPVNAAMRKATSKTKGAQVSVLLGLDDAPLAVCANFLDCLSDEPGALEKFNAMPCSHQRYYSTWIESAKTEPTKTKRIAMAINSLAKNWDFGTMLREQKKNAIR